MKPEDIINKTIYRGGKKNRLRFVYWLFFDGKTIDWYYVDRKTYSRKSIRYETKLQSFAKWAKEEVE